MRAVCLALHPLCLALLLAAVPVPAPTQAQSPAQDQEPRTGPGMPPRLGGDSATAQEAERYRSCSALAARNPGAAFEAANTWRGEGGGAPAIHCAAVALSALGEDSAAAELLEGLAAGGVTETDPAQAARMLVQAGRAWLAADRLDRAEAAQSRAITLVPSGTEPWVDRAVTRAVGGRFEEARTDLDRALQIDPGHDEARVLRASALRRLGRPREALADLGVVLGGPGPAPADALIERGRVLAELGDPAAARADFLAVLRTMPADSPSLAAAQAALEALDMRPD